MRQPIIDIIFGISPDPTEGWFDIDLQESWGETPLHIPIYRQSPELAQRLLEKGARRDLPTNEGNYLALHYAVNLSTGEYQNALVRLLAEDHGVSGSASGVPVAAGGAAPAA